MKRFCFLGLFWILVSLTGCETETTVRSDCADGGAFVKNVEHATGRVYFDSTEARYMILVPNSMDSHDVGFVCSLDTPFQKEGLLVKFSGRYYAYNKVLTRFAGDRFYALAVDTISR
jgi:hypothetical protein